MDKDDVRRKNLKMFSKEYQPEKNGRKKRLYNKLVDNGISHDDIKNLFKVALTLSLEELKGAALGKMPDDLKPQFGETVPAALNILATALIGDIKAHKMANLENLLTRVYGRPTFMLEGNLYERVETVVLNEAGMDMPDEEDGPTEADK